MTTWPAERTVKGMVVVGFEGIRHVLPESECCGRTCSRSTETGPSALSAPMSARVLSSSQRGRRVTRVNARGARSQRVVVVVGCPEDGIAVDVPCAGVGLRVSHLYVGVCDGQPARRCRVVAHATRCIPPDDTVHEGEHLPGRTLRGHVDAAACGVSLTAVPT